MKGNITVTLQNKPFEDDTEKKQLFASPSSPEHSSIHQEVLGSGSAAKAYQNTHLSFQFVKVKKRKTIHF